jgi:hypothetical protein
VLAYKDPPILALKSLARQTMQMDKVVIIAAHESACIDSINGMKIECFVDPPKPLPTVGERVGVSLTKAFKKFDISNYDYIVKLDSDVVLDEKFIERNICRNLDVIGIGAAMIVSTRCYLKYIGERWPISPYDDNFVVETLMALGCKTFPFKWPHPPRIMRKPGNDLLRAYRIGVECYKLGIHSLRVLSMIIRLLKNRNIAFLYVLSGYTAAVVARQRRYKYASIISRFNKMYIKSKIIRKLRITGLKYEIPWIQEY